MAGIGRYIYNTLSAAIFSSNNGNMAHEGNDYFAAMYSSDRYQPSVSDVIAVKEALHTKSTLPYELVDSIVDMAEYWPHNTTDLTESVSVKAGRDHENRFLLRSYPLGYPQQDPQLLPTPEEYQLAFEFGKKYKTAQPKPWSESRHVPGEATDEVLTQWSSKSLPKGEHPCRKIVFKIRSHDQGWGGNPNHKGTYEGSYTWFDVGLERISATREDIILNQPEKAPMPQFLLNRNDLEHGEPSETTRPEPLICNLRTILPATPPKPPNTSPDNLDFFQHDLLPSTMVLQKNVTAIRDTKEHEITWLYDDNVVTDSLEAAELERQGRGRDAANGEFVRNLKVGDVVTVWAKARFPQWINHVEEVRMDVYWAV